MRKPIYSDDELIRMVNSHARAGKTRPVGYLIYEKDAHLIKEMVDWRRGRPLRLFCWLMYAALLLSGLIHQTIAPLMVIGLAATALVGLIGSKLLEVRRD